MEFSCNRNIHSHTSYKEVLEISTLEYPGRLERPWPSSEGGSRFLWYWVSYEAPAASTQASGHILPLGRYEVAVGHGPELYTQLPEERTKREPIDLFVLLAIHHWPILAKIILQHVCLTLLYSYSYLFSVKKYHFFICTRNTK